MAPVEAVLEADPGVLTLPYFTISHVQLSGSLFIPPDNPEFQRTEVSPGAGGDFIPLLGEGYLAFGDIAGSTEFGLSRGGLSPGIDLGKHMDRSPSMRQHGRNQ